MNIRVIPSEPRSTRYMFEFSAEEIKDMLKKYILDQGKDLPQGSTFIWGLENNPCTGGLGPVILLVDVPVGTS